MVWCEKMKKISVRTRNRFMRRLLAAAKSSNGNSVQFNAPEIEALKKRKDFQAVMQVLGGLGLIAFARNDTTGRLMWYTITDAGMCYFEKRSDEFRNFLLTSIVVPIIVSILTTAVAVYILPPLGRRVEAWLAGLPESIPQSTQDLPPTDAPSDTLEIHTEDRE